MALDRPGAGPTQLPPPRGWRRTSGTRGARAGPTHRHHRRFAAACRRSRRTASRRPTPTAQRDPAPRARRCPLQHRREGRHLGHGPIAEHRRSPLRRRRRHGPHPPRPRPAQPTHCTRRLHRRADHSPWRGRHDRSQRQPDRQEAQLRRPPTPWGQRSPCPGRKHIGAVGSTVRHIAAATNQAAATKSHR